MLKNYLRQLVAFSDEELTIFEQLIQEKNLAAKQYFLQENEYCRKVAFVVEGVFKIAILDDYGNERILEFIEPNQFVTDYTSFLTQIPAQTNIMAIKPAKILQFSKRDTEFLYQQGINFQIFGRMIAENYYLHLDKRIREGKLSPKEKYDRIIEERPQLLQLVPQYMIASYLGVSAEWLSKIRAKK